jgi:positive phototaxis protein PixI
VNSILQHQLNDRPNLPPDYRQAPRQFLKFYLQSELAVAIEIELVTELMNISIGSAAAGNENRVVPMPNLPSAVLGVYNWRGEVLWIVDLATRLGLHPQAHQGRRTLQSTIVVTTPATSVDEAKSIGFVVETIAEIEWCEPLHQDATPPLPGALFPWLKGYWRSPTGEILPELDGQALINRE